MLSLFMKDPLTAEEHNNLGVIYEREGKNDLAIREYKSAISNDNTLITPIVNLGNVYFKKGEYTKAEKYYKKALKKDKTNLEAANNLASLYLEIGATYALDTIGGLYIKLGDNVKAEQYLTQACNTVEDNDSLKEEIRSHLWLLGINKRCGS